MPSATGDNWEKYKKNFADEEEPEKKITPLTDEYVACYHPYRPKRRGRRAVMPVADEPQGHPSTQDLRRGSVRERIKKSRETN